MGVKENTLTEAVALTLSDFLRTVTSSGNSQEVSVSILKTLLDTYYQPIGGDPTVVYTVTNGMTSAQIIAVFDEAQTNKNTNVDIQFEDGSYTISSDYTFTSMASIRILGNSDDDGSGGNKAVDISTGDYSLFFEDCNNVVAQFLEISPTRVGSDDGLFDSSNSIINVTDCYISNTVADTYRYPFYLRNGGRIIVKNTTVDEFGYVTRGAGFFEWRTGNTLSATSASWDPYIEGTSTIAYIPSSWVSSDSTGRYTYTKISNDNTSWADFDKISFGSQLKGWESVTLEASNSGAKLYLDTEFRSTTVRDDTTASASNMYCDPSTGDFKRSTSSESIKKEIDEVPKEKFDLVKSIATQACIKFKSKATGDDPNKDFIGFSADKMGLIFPEAVHWQTKEDDGFDIKPVKNKDGSPKLNSDGSPMVVEKPKF